STRSLSLDHVDVAVRRPAAVTERLAALAEILDRDLVEARLDAPADLFEGLLGHRAARRVALLGLRLVLGRRHRDGALERAHDVAQPDLGGRLRELVAAARAAARRDQPGALEILEDLLEEARRDRLTL